MKKVKNQWVSAKDCLPSRKGRYLTVCREFRSAVVRYYDKENWHSWQEVLYWMPLPKIPKEIKNAHIKEA